MNELRRAALEAETPERVREVVDRMRTLALAGDVPAARTYLDTVIGKPPQGVELSGPDGAPLGVDLAAVEVAVLTVLKPYGEAARFQVAMALRGMAIDAARAAEQPGDPA
jgi:hypothetical protein